MTSYAAVSEASNQIPESELTGIVKSVETVLQSWANLSSRYIGMPAEGPATLPLEVSVRFSSPCSVFLNVRTTSEMARVLVSSIRCQAVYPIPEEEVFKEFVNFLSDRLMAYLWGNNKRPFKTNEQFFSTPRNWPPGEPTAGGAFIVKNYPIEVRLWTESKGREGK